MSQIILDVKKLNKKFNDKTILDELSFKLEEGKLYTLCGHNGAGKSTLIKILMRLESPDEINGEIFGINLDKDDGGIFSQIGLVTESIELNFPFKITTLIELYPKIYPNWSKDTFLSLMEKLGLNIEKKMQELSRGQKMQVAFALATAVKPKLMLIDEITAVLDPSSRDYICKFIKTLTIEGCTVLMATNLVSEIQQYSDHLFLINQGKFAVNCEMSKLSELFYKIRKVKVTDDSFFSRKDCIEVSVNSDASVSYLIPKSNLVTDLIPENLEDKRKVTAEEVFIYYSRLRGGNRV